MEYVEELLAPYRSVFTGDIEYDTVLTLAKFYTVFVIIGCVFFSVGYGKFSEAGFGVDLDPRLGWFLMELPASVSFNYFYWSQAKAFEPLRLFCAFLFIKHYLNRGFFFPFSIRVAPNTKTSFSISVVLIGVFFTTMHGYLNARWFGTFATFLSDTNYISSPYFSIFYPMYEMSYWLTIYHEYIQRNLRPKTQVATSVGSEKRYKIPRGGLFEYVTNATYFTELLAWFSWMMFTRNPAGAFVFIVSCANLLPRAFQQHTWYKQKFDEYPTNRKVIVPFVI